MSYLKVMIAALFGAGVNGSAWDYKKQGKDWGENDEACRGSVKY